MSSGARGGFSLKIPKTPETPRWPTLCIVQKRLGASEGHPILVASEGRWRDRVYDRYVKVLTLVRIGILALVVFAGLALGLFLWQPVWLLHSHELRTGNEIVSRV